MQGFDEEAFADGIQEAERLRDRNGKPGAEALGQAQCVGPGADMWRGLEVDSPVCS